MAVVKVADIVTKGRWWFCAYTGWKPHFGRTWMREIDPPYRTSTWGFRLGWVAFGRWTASEIEDDEEATMAALESFSPMEGLDEKEEVRQIREWDANVA